MKKLLKPIKFAFTSASLLAILITPEFPVQAGIKIRHNLAQSNQPKPNNSPKPEPTKKPNNTNQPNQQSQENLPPPPKTGTYKGRSTSGITHPVEACKSKELPLTALFRNDGNDFTSKQNLTLWFYVPYNSNEIRYMEVSLQNEEKTKTLYRGEVLLKDNKPGIFKVDIPVVLTPNNNYNWYFTLQCKSKINNEEESSIEADKLLYGWVRRQAYNPNYQQEKKSGANKKCMNYSANGMWYDAINNIANKNFDSLGNSTLNEDWKNLLNCLNVKEGTEKKPLIESKLRDIKKE